MPLGLKRCYPNHIDRLKKRESEFEEAEERFKKALKDLNEALKKCRSEKK